MTASKKGQAVPMQPKALTPEELAKAQFRSIGQKVESTAQGVLFNLANNPEAVKMYKPKEMADVAIETAAYFVESLGDRLKRIFEELFPSKAEAEK